MAKLTIEDAVLLGLYQEPQELVEVSGDETIFSFSATSQDISIRDDGDGDLSIFQGSDRICCDLEAAKKLKAALGYFIQSSPYLK